MGQKERYFPTKEVTRAEAAKIIAYLMVGDSREADALKTTSDPFSDVSKNHWAAGYIAYLVQEGVLDGVGGGKFDPNGKVTGLAFAKMLLTALGYGVNDEYVGTDWAINVAKDALNYGIYDGNLAGANNEAATREECALYAFNTLFLQKVTYSALLGGYIEDNWTNAESNKDDSFANDFNLTRVGAGDDAFERPMGHVWKVGKKTISAAYGADQYLVGEYTTGVSGNEVYNLLGKSLVNKLYDEEEKNYEYVIYVDGAAAEKEDWNIARDNTAALKYTGNGIQTYIYEIPVYEVDKESGDTELVGYEVRVCIINTWLAQVVDVDEETKKAPANTEIRAAVGVDADDVVEVEEWDYETEEFAVGELVLVTYSEKKGDEGVQSMVPATLTEAKITKYVSKTGTLTAGGDDYNAAKNDYVLSGQRASAIDFEEVKGETYTLIVDEYGYLIGITQDVPPTEYVYVAQFGQKINTGDSLSDTTALSALIYYIDPESETGASSKVEIVKNANELLDEYDFEEKAFDDNYEEIIKALNASYTGLYTYEQSKGMAVLGRKDWNNWLKDNEDANVWKGISRMYNGERGHYATTKSTFFYVEGIDGDYEDQVVYGYVGINKVPAKNAVGAAKPVEGFATTKDATVVYDAVLVDYTPKASSDSTDVYFYTGNFTDVENEDGTWTVIFDVLDGEDSATIEFTYKEWADADEAIKEAKAMKNEFVVAGANKQLVNYADDTVTPARPADKLKGYIDAGVMSEMYAAGEVYQTTMYTDTDEAGISAWLENAVIVDRYGADKVTTDSMRDLQEMAAELPDGKAVQVAFAYNVNSLEISVVYVLGITDVE